MENHPHIIPIHPIGHLALPRDNKENILDKWHVFPDPPQKELESTPVSVALCESLSTDSRGVLGLPDGIKTIHISYDSIHRYWFINDYPM